METELAYSANDLFWIVANRKKMRVKHLFDCIYLNPWDKIGNVLCLWYNWYNKLNERAMSMQPSNNTTWSSFSIPKAFYRTALTQWRLPEKSCSLEGEIEQSWDGQLVKKLILISLLRQREIADLADTKTDT